MKIKDLKKDKRNYRKHDKKNLELIKKSVSDVGFGRSVVIDAEDEIVCGNGLVSTLGDNVPVRVVETDGSELVVVKRMDLKTNDEKRKQLAVMDNSASDSSSFDLDMLKADFDVNVLLSWGVSGILLEELTKYTRKINIPVYEIQGECPNIGDCMDTGKADALIEQIDGLSCDDKLKDFLKKTATRMFDYNYKNIAEFYAHQNDDVKKIMEKLALVIIDLNKAIENGYVELSGFIEDCFLTQEGENLDR